MSTMKASTVHARPARGRRHRLADAGPVIALIVIVVYFASVSPVFLSSGNLTILFTQLSIPIVVATGMTFVILLGSIDLSVAGVMATSSLVLVLLARNDRNDVSLGILALLVATGAGAVFGLLNGFLNVRLRIPSFMATLGTGAIGVGVATVLFGGRAPRLLDEGLRALGTGSYGPVPQLFIAAMTVLALAWAVQRYTKLGRYGYIIGGDEPIASLSGIPVGRYKIGAFVVAGTASGLAGALSATQLGVGSPQIGANALFAAITAVVLGGTLLIGGRGGVLRSLVGVGILIVLANGFILVGFDSSVQIAVQGAVIIVAVAVTGWRLRGRIRVIK